MSLQLCVSLLLFYVTVLVGVLLRVSIDVIKHHNQKQLGEKMVCFLTAYNSLSKEVEAETFRQDVMQRLLRSNDYWLALHHFLSLLSYASQDHLPRVGPTLSEDNTFQACLVASPVEDSSQLRDPLSKLIKKKRQVQLLPCQHNTQTHAYSTRAFPLLTRWHGNINIKI